MTNDKEQLQQELKDKLKAGVKPSDLKRLKRSKSADDIRDIIPPTPPLPLDDKAKRIEFLVKENTRLGNELLENKAYLKKANDDWILASQKNIDYLKQWGEQQEKIKALTQELNDTLDDAAEEIDKSDKKNIALQRKLRDARTQLTNLTTQLRQTNSDLSLHQRAAEFRVANPFKDSSSNWWNDYAPLFLLLGIYIFSAWLLKSNINLKNYE